MSKYFSLLLLMLLSSNEATANIAAEMDKVLNKMGGDYTNYSGGGVYKDQLGGYYTGGSLFMRNPVYNIQPLNIQTPSLRSGCGGIDAYTGGFSYINKEHFINLMKDIASKAGSYAFTLALDQTSPMIANAIKYLQSQAQRMNELNINSCEAAATLTAGVWPKTEASNRLLCSQMGTSLGIFSDWAEARQGCSHNSFDQVMGKKQASEFKDILGSEFNLAWKALSTNGFLKGDINLAKFMMTISGTIVSRKLPGAEHKFNINYYPSRALDSNLLDTLIHGGQSKIYTCDEYENCLNVSEETFELKGIDDTSKYNNDTAFKGLIVKISETLDSIANKLREEGSGATPSLTEQEKGLINSTTLPIQKIMDVQMAFRKNKAPISWSEYTEAIAYDMLLGYLENSLEIIISHLNNLKNVQIDGELIKEFRKDIISVKRQVITKRHTVFEHLNTMLSIKQKTQLIERQLMNAFDEANSINDL